MAYLSIKNKNASGQKKKPKKRAESRNSSVGRALDWRSKGPWFDPGFRHLFNVIYRNGYIPVPEKRLSSFILSDVGTLRHLAIYTKPSNKLDYRENYRFIIDDGW